jgi:MFS family permease
MVKSTAETHQKTSSRQMDGLLGYGAVHASSSQSPPPPLPDPDTSITYWRLLKKNRDYRILIISFLITECGEWLTYMASINFIESQMRKSNNTTSRTSISILVAVTLLPNVLLSCFGGTLADSRDRRKSMIFLDICGAICALFFLVAYHLQSIHLIYITTFLQQSIAGVYHPCSSSIIPLTVSDDKSLQKAIILSELAWYAMSAFASSAGGFLVSAFGARNCFCKYSRDDIDCWWM